MRLAHTRTSVLALAAALASAGLASMPAGAQQMIAVRSGTVDTTPKTVGGTDTLTVEAGASLVTNANPTINWSTASTDLRITNSGTIASTATGGRAINASGGSNLRTVTLTNNAGGIITSQDDAFRINVNPTGGTITVNNYGSILTTNGGQALDFDAVNGGATIAINNYAGARLTSVNQDAIRPGQGAIVTNAGTIQSDYSGAYGNYDGVDWQAHTGTVVNQAGGVISGVRHGITTDTGVTVSNAGTILGRNGSGVGSDGTGTVVNLAGGTITGQWDGVQANGDGDGVDIDLIGSVTNSGLIQGLSATGVDSGGRPNSAEGVAMGGGTIVNNVGGTIFGAGTGILINHDTNPGGVADGATTITNAGTIRGGSGNAITMVGTFNDTLTNSGTITGAVSMGGGNDLLVLLPGSTITGTVDGGAGTDTVQLAGTGNGSFAGAVNFETLNVLSGNWTLTNASTFANGTQIATPGTLTGNSLTLTGAYGVGGTLTVNQANAGQLNATLSGSGTLVKSGAGTLTLGDQTGFTGTTRIAAGRLLVTGRLPSSVNVLNTGVLAGNGTVGSVSVANGGTVQPGNNGIGTLTVTGGYTQAAGSVYAADTNAAGGSDRIVVGGGATLASGAQLALTRDAGTYAIGSRYMLLTAAGGVSGTYTLNQTASGGTEFRLGQSGNALYADVVRTGASLATLAVNRNQAAVAPAFGALGAANPAYLVLTASTDDATVREALSDMSGEIHASLRTATVEDSQALEDGVRDRMLSGAENRGIWGQVIGRGGEDTGAAGTALVSRTSLGGQGGVDVPLGGGARAGVSGGYLRSVLHAEARASRAVVESTDVTGYVGGDFGLLSLLAGAGYSWEKNHVSRTVAFPGYSSGFAARYDGDVLHGFAEIGVNTPIWGAKVQPFVGLRGYRIETDPFTEAGGAVALRGARSRESFAFSTVGVRVETPITGRLSAQARGGWQHALGDRTPDAVVAFAGGAPFVVDGTILSRDAALMSLGLDYRLARNMTLATRYSGAIGSRGSDNTGRIALSFDF